MLTILFKFTNYLALWSLPHHPWYLMYLYIVIGAINELLCIILPNYKIDQPFHLKSASLLVGMCQWFVNFVTQVAQTHKSWRPLQGVGYNYFIPEAVATMLLGLKQGYPLYSPYGCMLGYYPSEAWLVQQKALPPQFYEASVTTGTRTHTLLIKHQRLNPVL